MALTLLISIHVIVGVNSVQNKIASFHLSSATKPTCTWSYCICAGAWQMTVFCQACQAPPMLCVPDLQTPAKLSKCRPIYIGKNQNPKTWVFCCTVYTARKTHNILGFWHEKRMREKPRISYLCFGKWCACVTSLYLWPYTCSAHYVAGRGRMIPLKVTYHVTKNPNNTGEIGASVYIGKKTSEILAEFQKITLRRWVFRFGFFGVFGEVASNFQQKTRMRERFGFFYASVNGTRVECTTYFSLFSELSFPWLCVLKMLLIIKYAFSY